MVSPRIVSFFIFFIKKLFPKSIGEITGVFQENFQCFMRIFQVNTHPLINHILRKRSRPWRGHIIEMTRINNRNMRQDQWFICGNRIFNDRSVFSVFHEKCFFQMHSFDVVEKRGEKIKHEFTFMTFQRIDMILDLYSIDNIRDKHPSFGRWL